MTAIPTVLPMEKEHPIGTCLSSNEGSAVFVPIPKNASTYGKKIFGEQLNWYKNFFGSFYKGPLIVFLRDPYDRWISGAVQLFTMKYSHFSLDDEVIEFACRQIVLDEHTLPQVNFIKNQLTTRMIFFDVNDQLSHNLCHYLKTQFNIEPIDVANAPLNMTYGDNKKQYFTDKIKKYLEDNPKYADMIKTYYSNDYYLRKTVNFYEAN